MRRMPVIHLHSEVVSNGARIFLFFYFIFTPDPRLDALLHLFIWTNKRTANERKKDVNLTLCNLIMRSAHCTVTLIWLAIDFANSFCDHCIKMNYQVLFGLNVTHIRNGSSRSTRHSIADTTEWSTSHAQIIRRGEQWKKYWTHEKQIANLENRENRRE